MGQVPSTWAVTKQIIHESGFGLNGLNRGLTATIGRNGVFNMIYFGFYHSVKGIVPEYKVHMIVAVVRGASLCCTPFASSLSIECVHICYILIICFMFRPLSNKHTLILQLPLGYG